MNKKEKYFAKIQEYKNRFKELSVEKIKKRLSLGVTIKEAAIAYRELLEEKAKEK